MKRTAILYGLLLTIALGAAESRALDLGDPAPPLTISEWIKGDPVEIKHAPATRPAEGDATAEGATAERAPDAAEPDAPIYVLKFWATWCPPCRASIPLMTELQRAYGDKGVVVVAISDEAPSVVRSFIDRQTDNKLAYTVAVDRRSATTQAYMGGVYAQGIPHAFVIDRQGRLAWHGSPFSGLGTVVKSILEGTYSLEARAMLHDYFMGLIEAQRATDAEKKDDLTRQARQTAERLMDAAGKDFLVLDLLAWNILTLEGLELRDIELADRAIERAMELSKGEDASVLDTYARSLWEKGDREKAIEQVKKAIERVDNDEDFKAVLVDRLKTYERSAAN